MWGRLTRFGVGHADTRPALQAPRPSRSQPESQVGSETRALVQRVVVQCLRPRLRPRLLLADVDNVTTDPLADHVELSDAVSKATLVRAGKLNDAIVCAPSALPRT